ncbi:tryptophan 2-C-methyltransferase [Streptoalloteichus hindustanus]|uniref:Tryptophan 2-C-methyltransferase n=1 Tax=Streptoalloteichus hindustanus TaxID=2017 RepID=A0A1M4Y7U2_STRHI|nr:tryptophan 2-C-methyltransferase [Streptoalloteichus hindustanus]SHF01884.1 tryptophan 2-C-methyltransferase [Streptoalloteichus hindustanus]
MGKALVTLVNPNKVHPPIAPYALDILSTSLEADGFSVEVLDLTFDRDDWRPLVRAYFATRRPLLVGITIRNTDTVYAQQQRGFVDEHREIVDEIRAATAAPVVGGGVGFSSLPFALVDHLDLDFGIKGPGEVPLVLLANAVLRGDPPDRVPGLIINEGGAVRQARPDLDDAGRVGQVNRGAAYTRTSGQPWRVDNLRYYQRGGLGVVLTKNGCPFACSYCVEPDAKGNRFARREVGAVVDEMEALLRQGVLDLHTADSEFNLNIAHSKAVLREVVRRRRADPGSPLRDMRLWVYIQPAPFDEEFADLLLAAGCAGINVAPDHVRDELLDVWKVTRGGARYHTWADLERVCALGAERGIATMVEVLLGMPGETAETMADCVRRTLALDATVVGYTLGIRIFPYAPLGMQLAEQCGGLRTVPGLQSNTALDPIVLTPLAACPDRVSYERQFLFDARGRFRPVCYFSPELPEDDATLRAPAGRWRNSLRLLRSLVPPDEHHRVMLPTEPGLTEEDNNYADNPFLLHLTALEYRGAYWSHWRDRDRIMREAAAPTVPVSGT